MKTLKLPNENTDVTAFLDSLEFDYKGGDEENTVDVAEIGLEKQLAERKNRNM